MKFKISNIQKSILLSALMIMAFGCSRDVDDLEPADYPTNGDVYIDAFSGGLDYAAFLGSVETAVSDDREVKKSGTASMSFAVPDVGDSRGSYAGGTFFSKFPRDLSEYDVLTFWAKSSKAANIDIIGFGNDLGENKYQASISDVAVNSNWKKYYIPLPDPSKLTREKGMFFYSEGPEDGKGYTFWIDEIQFEKSGKIANKRAKIAKGETVNVTAETGQMVQVDGLQFIANAPNSDDVTVDCAPAYFIFNSSDESVATVNDMGKALIMDAGTTEITATLGNTVADGKYVITSTGDPVLPQGPAPTPTQDADDVISLFSNVYDNVPVDTWNTRWEFSTADNYDVKLGDDDMIRYVNLNFVGITFTAPTINASEMTHFHMDVWTPDPTDPPAVFKILLRDFGANDVFDESGDDSSHELSISGDDLKTEQWMSLDIPMSDFAGLVNRGNLAQLVLSGDLPNIFIDNVYFYNDGNGGGSDGPDVSAPNPDKDAGDVISIFSDSYDDVEGTDFNPDWGQSTVVTQIDLGGNKVLNYAGFNYQGIQFASGIDVSEMDYLHMDYWTDNSTLFNAYLISDGPVEKAKSLNVPTEGWVGIDIPLSEFSPVDLANVIQMKFDGNGNIYLDNIYFFKGDGGGGDEMPMTPAPAPTVDADNVLSIFSDVYTDLEGTNFFPDWGQTTVVTTEDIMGDAVLKYDNFNYQGTILRSNVDASGMEFLHVDMWTADATNVTMTPVSSTGENLVGLTPINAKQWNSYDIPLSAFADGGVTLSDIFQLKFDGQAGNTPSTIYLDNIYFHKEGGGSDETPMNPAPTPMVDANNVLSIFSDVYMDIDGTNFFPDWGQTTVVTTEDIMGDAVLKYDNFNYQGTVLGSTVDASGMEFLHVDMWTADATNVTMTPISSTGENLVELTPINAKQWNSYDIPLSAFADGGVTLSDIFQLKFDGQAGNTPSTIYLDNIYFHKTGGGGDDTPTSPAPTPMVDEDKVVSIFSDVYDDLMGTEFFPDWGQSTTVTTEDIMGDAVLKYENFNYQGTTLSGPTDLSTMEFLHIDMWTTDATVVLMSPISLSSGESLQSLTPINAGQWNSYDIPLSVFTDAGMTMSDIHQLKFDGQSGESPSNIYLDNIYFYRVTDVPMSPSEAAPDPIHDANRVLSVYSDSYGNLSGTEFFPNWGQTTVVSEELIDGNNTLKYGNFNYQGTILGSTVDASNMDFIHVDVWTADATVIKMTPISSSSGEFLAGLEPIISGVWNSYDIPLSTFTDMGVSMADLFQLKFDGQEGFTPADVYIDNIYFYQDGAAGPSMGAPVPTHPEADVISIYSDSYTDVSGSNYNPAWGQATVVTDEVIDGNNTLLYSGLNYQGLELGSNQDVSGMTTLHLDIWSNSSTELQVFLISPGPVEVPVSISVPTSGWQSVEISLSDFSPVDMSDVFQFKFVGNGDVYLDNIYFHR